jgi:RES domain-containing protein
MWAERQRATDATIAPADDERWVCTFDVDLSILDLRDPATRRALRVSEEDLRGPWAPDRPNAATLRVAAAARELGVDGLVVPSAARPEGWNLAVLPGAFGRLKLAARRRGVPPG